MVRFIDITPQDGDNQKLLSLFFVRTGVTKFIDKVGGSLKLFCLRSSDTGVRTSYVGFCMIITNKEVKKVMFLIEAYWCSDHHTTTVPSNNSRVIVDDENEEHVGPNL